MKNTSLHVSPGTQTLYLSQIRWKWYWQVHRRSWPHSSYLPFSFLPPDEATGLISCLLPVSQNPDLSQYPDTCPFGGTELIYRSFFFFLNHLHCVLAKGRWNILGCRWGERLVLEAMGVTAEATPMDEITEHVNRKQEEQNKILDDFKSKESEIFTFKLTSHQVFEESKASYQAFKESKAMLLCPWSGCRS